ncbi:VOC family protein [Glaciecola sp. KUL10]|uniref:VOC family protein n=1 Tax=Glaciecola sp. (strain KUL10) TaxID=2161813 RepID=UPI000D82E62F|nr:VOC family protein [Glaciecola sp. KUL10]GBL03911.1 glyoxalase/bleomycin resistance protein/dioxygenase superfamily protein [Glaciecola sp. KUL10]
MSINPFHLAIPVSCLDNARKFYGDLLGCSEGRSSEQWIDWNLYGHQLVTHKVAKMPEKPAANQVDAKAVPIPHFGVVLDMPSWQLLADKLKDAKVEFVIEPYIRFKGQAGEQATLFLLDPCGNALEFKGFKDMNSLFDAG